IGLKLILSREEAEPPAPASGRLFRQGFVTSMANPYAVVFFGALFPQFIDTAQPVWPQLLILGLTYLVVDGGILVLWGWSARHTIGRLKSMTNLWINRVSGALMLGAAVLLGFKDIDHSAR
ncbi:MAG: LysE family translocator, partial [Pseudomonadota bacterium]